jgi:hypothetical protein
VIVQTIPVSKWVAVLRQARRDRRLSNAKITRLVLSPCGHGASGGEKREYCIKIGLAKQAHTNRKAFSHCTNASDCAWAQVQAADENAYPQEN